MAGTASAPDPANRHGPGQPIRPTVPAAETAHWSGPCPCILVLLLLPSMPGPTFPKRRKGDSDLFSVSRAAGAVDSVRISLR